MRIPWKKIFTIIFDVALAGYIGVAFTAFNKPADTGVVCDKVMINIADETTNGFITSEEVTRRLKAHKAFPHLKPLSLINTRQIEDVLKQSPFVESAECYKTINGDVTITISQMMPLVRIKSNTGDDYYIDNKDCVMPNSNYTSDLIICTGNITRTFATQYISPLSATIMANELWKNQIVQINVLTDKSIEIVPRIGDHIVNLGQLPQSNDKTERKQLIEDFMARKMDRLEKFYKYGLSKAGWNKYSYINLEFDNQIICKRRKNRH